MELNLYRTENGNDIPLTEAEAAAYSNFRPLKLIQPATGEKAQKQSKRPKVEKLNETEPQESNETLSEESQG